MSVKKKVKKVVSVAREIKSVVNEVKREFKNEPKKEDSLSSGLILISIGLILLVTNYFGWGFFWPLVFLIPITVLIISYIKEKDKGVIIPLTILTVIMLVFLSFTLNILSWGDLAWLWPVFVMAPGLGILFYYLGTGMKDNDLIIPVSILLGLSVLFFAGIWMYWPLILIVIGIIVLIKSRKD